MFLIFSTESKLVSQLCLRPFASPTIGAVAPSNNKNKHCIGDQAARHTNNPRRVSAFIHGTSARAAVPEASSQPALLLVWKEEGELCSALALRVLAVSRARLSGVVGEWAGAGKESQSLAG